MNERLVKPMSVEELDSFASELTSEAMKRFQKHKVLQKASNTKEMEQKLSVSGVYIYEIFDSMKYLIFLRISLKILLGSPSI